MKDKNIHPIKYMSFGSPLMDFIGDVSQEFIKDNGIKLNTTIHSKINDIKFFEIFTKQNNISCMPGGCQFIAMRVFNWMLKLNKEKDETDIITFLGSVGGGDDYGEKYKNLLKSEGINSIFETIPDQNTGVCVAICHNQDRALITDLGASISITDEFIEKNWDKFKDVKLIYTELFILRHKREFCFKLATFGSRDETIYGFNLPAEFFLKNYIKDIYKICAFADIIFANQSEASLYCSLLGYEVLNPEDTEELAYLLSKNIPKQNNNKNRIVVVTFGPKPASVCEFNHKKQEIVFKKSFDVKKVDPDKIIDTDGAGDSFAGGFLSKFMKKKDLKECMKAGHYAASIMIQRRGYDIPKIISND